MKHTTHDLGWVGDIQETHAAPVEALLDVGLTPIVSPISLGLDGHTYNVNADHAATALACALGAVELAFVSNVPGVLGEMPPLRHQNGVPPRKAGGEERAHPRAGARSSPSPVGFTGEGRGGGLNECIPALTPQEVDALIASGVIHGGMVPKVRSALAALERGVSRVRITDLQGLANDGGTCFLEK
jgi:acetylglutamate kinase